MGDRPSQAPERIGLCHGEHMGEFYVRPERAWICPVCGQWGRDEFGTHRVPERPVWEAPTCEGVAILVRIGPFLRHRSESRREAAGEKGVRVSDHPTPDEREWMLRAPLPFDPEQRPMVSMGPTPAETIVVVPKERAERAERELEELREAFSQVRRERDEWHDRHREVSINLRRAQGQRDAAKKASREAYRPLADHERVRRELAEEIRECLSGMDTPASRKNFPKLLGWLEDVALRLDAGGPDG